MRPIGIVPTIMGVACLMACSQPTGQPVPMAQPGDEQLSCSEINAQMKSNLAASPDDSYRRGSIVAGALTGGVIGAVIAANTADQTDVGQVEARSLADRNERLAFLARSKGCSEP
jgi:hypothetical protein